jgi:hypothetical protein
VAGPTEAEQIVRFVAVRAGIAQQRLAQDEAQARDESGEPERSTDAARARVRALELLLASCMREAVAHAAVQLDPPALRGRWTPPPGGPPAV